MVEAKMQNTIVHKGRNYKYFKTQISKVFTIFLHGGTTPWSAVGVSASTHFQPRPIPGWEKKRKWVGGNLWLRKWNMVSSFSRGSKTRLFTQLQHLVNRIKAGILGGQLLRAPNSQRPPRATKALWLAIFGKNPPAPSGTEHWILGHQGLQPRALTKIYVWASRRGVPLILWHVSPPATNRNACILAKLQNLNENVCSTIELA